MTNKERIQAHNELLRKGIETAEGLPDAGGSVADPVIEPLEVTKNGLYAVPDGVDGYSPIMVNVPQTGGECEHEVYDLSVQASPDVRLKPKIEKPTDAQIDKFVNNSIALIADDVEALDGILALEYQVLPITDDIALPVVWFRTEMKDFRAYYVWQEDIEIGKMALASMGLDVSGITGEGWQLETDTGFRTLSVEELQQYDFYREDYYMIPYGDYYYSLFDISLYNKEPADIVAVRDGYVLETQDTLCEKDIYISHNPSRTVWVSSQDGMSVGEGLTEYDDLMYIDLEIVGDCPDHCVSVEGYAYNAGGNRRTSFYSTLGNEYRKQKLTVTSGYGIHLEAFDGFEFGEIYTNATILEQSETEVYISGLRHNTHIIVVAKDNGGGGSADEWIGDGNTHLWITLQDGRTSPMLGLCPKGTVTVDWGDGTTPDVLTGTNISTVKWTPTHEYAKAGDYVINLTVDGEMAFSGNQASNENAYILRHSSSSDVRNRIYQSALKKVEFGNGVTSIGNCAFRFCYALASVAIPDGVTSIGDYAFAGCGSLRGVDIPNSVTSIGSGAFSSCNSLASVVIPDGVTSIGTSAFASSSSVANVVVPAGVTSINNQFSGLSCVSYYDFTRHTAVPSLTNSSGFSGIPTDCEIRVPAALYDEWIAATNWSKYASYIVAV